MWWKETNHRITILIWRHYHPSKPANVRLTSGQRRNRSCWPSHADLMLTSCQRKYDVRLWSRLYVMPTMTCRPWRSMTNANLTLTLHSRVHKLNVIAHLVHRHYQQLDNSQCNHAPISFTCVWLHCELPYCVFLLVLCFGVYDSSYLVMKRVLHYENYVLFHITARKSHQ